MIIIEGTYVFMLATFAAWGSGTSWVERPFNESKGIVKLTQRTHMRQLVNEYLFIITHDSNFQNCNYPLQTF
jgi:hypothetical protein